MSCERCRSWWLCLVLMWWLCLVLMLLLCWALMCLLCRMLMCVLYGVLCRVGCKAHHRCLLLVGFTAHPTDSQPTQQIYSPPNRFTADRKSTRPNSSHVKIPYAAYCLKKK